jgi:hypothetical protein
MATRKTKAQATDRTRDLEIALEEERSLSSARNTLLETNIKELNDVYVALNEKLKALRDREERIKGFEAQLVRANKLSSLGELAGSIENHEIIEHLALPDAREIIEAVRPGTAILTHFGMHIIKEKPWLLAKRLAKETGVNVIAGRDGMKWEF